MTRLTAAERAANVHPPLGRYKNLALAEIFELEVGRAWLLWALLNIGEAPHRSFHRSLWTFARTYAPDLHSQAADELQAKAS